LIAILLSIIQIFPNPTLFESYLNRIFEEKGDDWEEKKLREVCNIIGGGTPSKKNVPSLMISLEIFLNHLKRNPTDNCFEALGIMPFKS
jgi:restriction endonuclease S subunit